MKKCEIVTTFFCYTQIYVFLLVQTACIGINLVQICGFFFHLFSTSSFLDLPNLVNCIILSVREICLEIARARIDSEQWRLQGKSIYILSASIKIKMYH